MTMQLFSVEHAPVSLPIWHTILADLSDPPASRVARCLGLSVRSVYRYNRTGRAPRCALLALFWLTRWGRSAVNAQAVNDAVLSVALARSLQERVAELTDQVRQLQALGDFGSANAPILDGVHHG